MSTETDPVRLSFRDVCARRLEWHGLARPSAGSRPADVARAMAGVHAQVISGAELGVGLRIAGVTRTDVRTALWGDHSLIKTFGPRGTVHLLPRDDLPLWVAALSAVPPPREGFPEDVRMTPEQTEKVLAAIAEALQDGELTIDELNDEVIHRAGSWAGDLVMPAFQGRWARWRQAVHLAGMRGVLCFGPNRGRKVTYTHPGRWSPGFEPAETPPALAHVVKSYLRAYGPATPQRFAHWLNAPARWAADLFASLAGDLQQVEVEGVAAWVVAGDTAVPAPVAPSVRLLPYFDTYAYRVGNQPPGLLYPGRAGERVLRGNFQALIVDGVVAGLWHQRRSGGRVDLTVEPLVRLDASQQDELGHQAERVGEILEARARLTIGTVTVGGHA
ncbi:winged helix DNA-binding domain-containing protein [Planotetraspora mira]|uniref:Winged helix DNA-binding domain-containing protein n=1 Tax=Planotetraspora mira TaxID=58121 RepID=A0A8J3X5X4_9ACTN|nr:winged helix DNA-binding domain-containing protein [Planotetraspora mira]GII28189.1 hypothetical protein Pmi06nite_16310 [Planotetraspora mira]